MAASSAGQAARDAQRRGQPRYRFGTLFGALGSDPACALTRPDIGTLAVNGLLFRAVRGAPPRGDLAAPGSVPRVLATTAAFAAVVFGVILATGLSLKAAGVPYRGMIATAVGMMAFVPGGLALTRYHTAVQVRRPGGRG